MPIPDIKGSSRLKRLMLNDCVYPEVGLKIFELVTNKPQQTLFAISKNEGKNE